MHILTQFQVETQCPPHFGFPAPIKTCLHLQRDAHVERVVRFVAYLPSAAPAPAAAAAVELQDRAPGVRAEAAAVLARLAQSDEVRIVGRKDLAVTTIPVEIPASSCSLVSASCSICTRTELHCRVH